MKCKKCNTENEEGVKVCNNCGAKLKKKNAFLIILLVMVIIIVLVAIGLLIRYAVVQDSYFAPVQKLFGLEEDYEDDDEEKNEKKDKGSESDQEDYDGKTPKTLLSSEAKKKDVDHYTAEIDILDIYEKAKEESPESFENDEMGMMAMLDYMIGLFDGSKLTLEIYAKGDEELLQAVVTFKYEAMLKNIYDMSKENMGDEDEIPTYEEYKKEMVKELNEYLTKENMVKMLEEQMDEYDIDFPKDFEDYFDIVSLDGAVEIYFDLDGMNIKDLITDNVEEMGIDEDDILGSSMDLLKEYGVKVTKE